MHTHIYIQYVLLLILRSVHSSGPWLNTSNKICTISVAFKLYIDQISWPTYVQSLSYMINSPFSVENVKRIEIQWKREDSAGVTPMPKLTAAFNVPTSPHVLAKAVGSMLLSKM